MSKHRGAKCRAGYAYLFGDPLCFGEGRVARSSILCLYTVGLFVVFLVFGHGIVD